MTAKYFFSLANDDEKTVNAGEIVVTLLSVAIVADNDGHFPWDNLEFGV